MASNPPGTLEEQALDAGTEAAEAPFADAPAAPERERAEAAEPGYADSDTAPPLDIADGEHTAITWVGIGASAGGLEALRNLVRNLDSDLPATYIVAQHMAPRHKSMLAEIIGRETDMPVRDVIDGTEPRPCHLYITPPNKNIVVDGDTLRLLDPSPEPAAPKPSIDVLFGSLAERFGERAIGIVLSGTGADGAEGIRAVHEHGGTTCAQDDTAKNANMPEAAIGTGCVDVVLSPDELGKRFAELLAEPRDLSGFETPPVSADGVSAVVNLLLERTKVNFRHYKSATVQRRLERRMAALGVDAIDEYVAIAESTPEEVDALFRDLLITVTSFFRDPEEFAALTPHIRSLVDKKHGGQIRVWIPAAATGEEPYALAMLLAEALGGPSALESARLQIFATDIDDVAIEQARRGFYADALVEQVPPRFVGEYFDRAPGGYTVRKALREKIIFSVHNVAQDPPFLNIDLISCRNLLIYFQSTLQAQVFARFRYALVPHGLLFLGKSENVGSAGGLFKPLGPDGRVFVQQPLARRVPPSDDLYVAPERRRSGSRIEMPAADTHELAIVGAQLSSLVAAIGPDALLVSSTMEIRRAFGDVSPYVGIESGVCVSTSAMTLVREPFRQDLRSLVPTVIGAKSSARSAAHDDPTDPERQLRLLAHPIDCGPDNETLALVVFESRKRDGPSRTEIDGGSPPAMQRHVDELERELAVARRNLRQTVEELETSSEELQALNEELQSSNEELQSSNEELETSNEELQSTNEELSTVNEELQVSSQQLNLVNRSLTSVLDNVGMPLIVVDRAMNVTHASKASESVFRLAPDLVLPHITRCKLPEGIPPLVDLLDEAMEGARRVDREIVHRSLSATLSAVPHFSSQGEMIGAIVLLSDNTEQLKRTQRELQLIFDSVPVSIMVRDRQGRIIKANPAAADLLNVPPEELTGAVFHDFLKDDVATRILAADREVLESGRPEVDSLLEFVFRDGRAMWVRVTRRSAEYPGIEGKVLYSVKQDVTGQQRVQNALELSEMRLEQAIDASNAGLWDWQPETHALFWSKRFMEIVGIEESGFSGRDDEFFDRLHPEDTARVRQVLAAHLERDDAFSLGYRLRHADGRYRWIDAHGKVRRDENGRMERVIGTVVDITEQRQNVHVLRERNRQLDLAQHISGVGYWKLDRSDDSLFWSDQIYAIHGVAAANYTPDLASGVKFYHPDDIPKVEHHLAGVLERHGQFEFEARLIQPGGDIRTVQAAGQSEVDDRGEVVAVFGVFRDVTDLRAREADLERTLEELSRSNEELNRFSYVCSHDMKEPVRMIESMSELLLDPDISRDETQRRELVVRIGRNMTRLKGTIDSLLAYSRLEAKVELVDVELNAVLAEVVDNLDSVIQDKSAGVESLPLPIARGARVHFQQLLQNLIGNALKYSDKPDPRVLVTGHRHAGQLVLTVEDNGPGIPNESLDDVFVVFSRLRLDSEIEGTGLGLAICRRIVTQYGGTIICRPSSLGGAAFDITLPVKD